MENVHPYRPIKLLRHPLSGHCHRVELMLSLLQLPYETVDIDLAGGQHLEPEFMRKNRFAQVPVIEDGAVTLADSNAIIVYLATLYDDEKRWYPEEAEARARVQRWLSVAAGEVFTGPASARLVTVFGVELDHERAKAIAHKLLGVVDSELRDRPFLVGNGPTLADVAAYSYIAHAPEGGVSLEPFEHVRGWLRRVQELPGFVAMKPTRAGLVA
jgi:glutathione S-transferase